MNICVVGLGYIGLPTAGLLALRGNQVFGFDINEGHIDGIKRGEFCNDEPDLSLIIEAALKIGSLVVDTQIKEADAYLISVPTPHDENKKCDNSFIESAAASIGNILKKGNLVILESTVAPGTTNNVLTPILEDKSGLKAGVDFYVAYSAERVLPGRIFFELVENDRIIGGINEESAKMAAKVYEKFVKGPIHITDCITAEITKLMENTYRDVNIALANEFAKMAETLGFDVWEAIKLANKHPRVNVLSPGPGVGGHCIAVDPWFLVESFPNSSSMVKNAREVNDGMPIFVGDKIIEMLNTEEKTIGILGVTYKENIDDTRESPSTELIKYLTGKGYTTLIHDPHAKVYNYELSPLDKVLAESNICVVMVGHNEFKDEKLIKRCSELKKYPRFFDAKNIISPKAKELGIEVKKLGKKV